MRQLELRWLLDRQISRLLAAQYSIDIPGRLSVLIERVQTNRKPNRRRW